MAALIIHQCLQGVVIFITLLSSTSWAKSENNLPVLCPSVANGIFGDLLHHYGCYLPGLDVFEDKMKPSKPSVVSSRIKPAIPPVHELPKWLEDLSSHLLNSTHLVNSFNQQENLDETSNTSENEGCGGTCPSSPSWIPQCCRVETRLLYPLYGRSLTSDRLVPIAQDLNPTGIQQPVVYRHCLSEETELVRGRCHQSTLPRLFFISTTGGGNPYKKDLILVPSNCECLVTLGQHIENGTGESDRHDTITSTTLLTPGEGSGTGGVSSQEPAIQEEGFIPHHQDS
ncbi:uncharacterized protein LOC124204383 [Daphnia pulex]|uniref:uncharacterized protein LOC124204383 n=1 Tax=Daphnia pulex TaxID=6669 RepID=UPI001EE0EA00|nr:uncharacterized protein LOC124204383 [Daphnia pulex]